MPSLDQERAAYAWAKVQKCSKDYENLAKAAPALIMNNGLMQTLAFFRAKGKEHHIRLNEHLCEWLGKRFRGVAHFPVNDRNPDFESIMPALHHAEPLIYRRATEEALAVLRWIRQFASAVRSD
jgi:CRISPR-associated protein Cmr5